MSRAATGAIASMRAMTSASGARREIRCNVSVGGLISLYLVALLAMPNV
jgi:hypothetical protein